jgi:hypothetical protein
MTARSLSARADREPPAPPPPPKPPIGSGIVIPFPFARRCAYIRRQIDNVAGYNPDAAKKYLEARIADRVRILRRAGVAEDLIAADIAPVAQIFRDGLRFLFGQRSNVS